MQKAAVILSGCGVYDGAEIQETVLTMLALERHQIDYQCFAPDKTQHHVINHMTGDEMHESRNVLVESARIVRGNVKPIAEMRADDFDFLLVPGGFGVAKNLCDFAVKGPDCQVDEAVLSACRAFADANKPTGYMCIAPAMLSHIYGQGVRGTIGTDTDTAEALGKMGVEHVACPVDEIVEDTDRKLITTPAYMLADSVSEAKSGIDKLVARVVELANG